MYSDKLSLNVLTVLLRDHNVRHAVLCPGSRNAPLTHNLTLCPDITTHNATDERSAGFEALGISLATENPVAVCVTSGSALLNLLPAVCEAWYQHAPLIVLSADRPAAWIDQLDGQTICQPDALARWCCCSVNLPEINDEESHWNCNWLVNKALVESQLHSRPVHINIPISEPLYNFISPSLPDERVLSLKSSADLIEKFRTTERIIIVTGQSRKPLCFGNLIDSAAVIAESLANSDFISPDADSLISRMAEPELVVYLGGTLVGKNIKSFLRNASNAEQWFVSSDDDYADTFQNLKCLVHSAAQPLLSALQSLNISRPYATQWQRLLADNNQSIRTENETCHESKTVSSSLESRSILLLQQLVAGRSVTFIYANSMSVRYACRYSSHYVFCNRGVNGIEGSISTALGIALAKPEELCICVTGDLSFFYDSNALWRTALPPNLRILLLNNGGGRIFDRFRPLADSPARNAVVGSHDISASGICTAHSVACSQASSSTDLTDSLSWLLDGSETRLLEIINK